MTPLDHILQAYRLPKELHGRPFTLHPLQVDAINTLASLPRCGNYLDTGTGKTVVETCVSLYRLLEGADTCVIIMPPVLVPQWARWLSHVKRDDGSDLRVVQYQGTKTKRQGISLDADFILVGIQIFKNDYHRFCRELSHLTVHVAVDEATMVANVGTDNHEKVTDFIAGRSCSLLTGTPANNPMDAYGLIKVVAPGTYRSLRHFQNVHVEEVDFFDKPKKFTNLDVLKANLEINSYRILFEDMYPDSEIPLYVPEVYELSTEHMRLYRRLSEEQLLRLPDGGKIDATQSGRILHALGQIIVNASHFSGDPGMKPAIFDVIENHLHELGSEKLVVFANYRMSVAAITQRFAKAGAVAINGDVSPKDKERAVARFTSDPACRVAVIHPRSAGYGLDGLQHVCNHALFAEPLQQPRDFQQCVARLKRTGQRKRVVVWLPAADKTLQVGTFKALIDNDTLINQVVRNAVSLRKLIYGDQ